MTLACMDTAEQHRHNATLQRKWAADAARDATYNAKRAAEEQRAGNHVLASGYKQETGFDNYWKNRRLGIARREDGKAGR